MALAWEEQLSSGLQKAGQVNKLVFVDFFNSKCGGCKRLDAAVYPDPQVESYISQYFVPVKLCILENTEAQNLAEQYKVRWTPTLLITDHQGHELWRLEGFIPLKDFTAYLTLGRAHSAFNRGDFATSANFFEEAYKASSDIAPEALYWLGVARYKGGSLDGLKEAWTKLWNEYRNSEWAKRASFLFT